MHATLSLQPDISKTRLSDAVYETVLEAILGGKLPAGTVVSEVSLARQLDVSRTPVHDALRQLSKDGLVLQRANHRAVVATFSQEDVYDICEMRILLEGEAAKRAATRIDRPTLARLREIAEQLGSSSQKSGWTERWVDFDEEFHTAIARVSGSQRLYQDIVRYRMLHRGFNKLTTTVDCLQQALHEHLIILDALDARDPERASVSMVEHIREWQAYFVSHFSNT
jgi:DNA-binding GntR family transcriptional regulator